MDICTVVIIAEDERDEILAEVVSVLEQIVADFQKMHKIIVDRESRNIRVIVATDNVNKVKATFREYPLVQEVVFGLDLGHHDLFTHLSEDEIVELVLYGLCDEKDANGVIGRSLELRIDTEPTGSRMTVIDYCHIDELLELLTEASLTVGVNADPDADLTTEILISPQDVNVYRHSLISDWADFIMDDLSDLSKSSMMYWEVPIGEDE